MTYVKDLIKRSFNSFFQKKDIVIYTAIFGSYDLLKEPPKKLAKKCDFICFTDDEKLKSTNYKIVVCKKNDMNSHLKSRFYKILPYKCLPKKYKYSIWIDGSMQLRDFDVNYFINNYLAKEKWVSFYHPERICIYDEALACISLGKDEKNVIMQQINQYMIEGYPKNNGLLANGFIARKHNDREVINVCNSWWKELKKGSKRDQLSFCYVAWKTKFKYLAINDNIWDNKYFWVLKHK